MLATTIVDFTAVPKRRLAAAAASPGTGVDRIAPPVGNLPPSGVLEVAAERRMSMAAHRIRTPVDWVVEAPEAVELLQEEEQQTSPPVTAVEVAAERRLTKEAHRTRTPGGCVVEALEAVVQLQAVEQRTNRRVVVAPSDTLVMCWSYAPHHMTIDVALAQGAGTEGVLEVAPLPKYLERCCGTDRLQDPRLG